MRHPEVPEDKRGTYAGLGTPEVLRHIKSLGVTAVELMPIHTFINDDFLINRGLSNYWGYNSIGFFAPHPLYAANPLGAVQEFKDMVTRFHEAGLEVILDVVFNHTAEGNERGATLSFKGIDNASYYQLIPDQKRYYINDTGTGNTFNLHHPRVMQMVLDSLRYWVQEMNVDGFRFDLACTLARGPTGFDRHSAFLQMCLFDPVLAGVKMIAEPWDIGPRRLSGRQLPARMGRVERQVPRRRPRRLARRRLRGHHHLSPLRLRGYVQPRGAAAVGLRQPRDGARWLHATRPRQLQPEAQ